MRLSICAAAIVSAALLDRCAAAPSFRSSSLGNPEIEAKYVESGGPEDNEALKYFHEPGYVLSVLSGNLTTLKI